MSKQFQNEENLKYCIYSRKSTESDELQQLSIDAQLKEMRSVANRENINILETLEESHSAKDSGKRPIFNQMVEKIRNGEYNAILTWAPDRLSRNAGDLGKLIDLMDQGILKQIKTYGQTFTNSPNEKFLLMILGSTAKLENDAKSVNVKRGLRAKCEKGWRPGYPPIGYLHGVGEKKGERKIYLDPKRAPIITEMFQKVAYQGYSGRALKRWFDENGFITRGGKKMALSSIYNILKNHFYYGEFEYPIGSGIMYKGVHEPLISKDLFQEVQIQLEVPPKSRPGTKEFDFTNMIKCGSCDSGVTAEEKFKKIKNDGSIRRYVYYHCNRFKNYNCNEPYTREEEIVEQLTQTIDKIDLNENETLKKARQEMERYQKFNNLIAKTNNQDKIKMPKVDIKEYAKYLLKEGSRDEKREILTCIKTQLFLKNKKIYTGRPS